MPLTLKLLFFFFDKSTRVGGTSYTLHPPDVQRSDSTSITVPKHFFFFFYCCASSTDRQLICKGEMMSGLFLKSAIISIVLATLIFIPPLQGHGQCLTPKFHILLSVLRFWGRPHPLDLFLECCTAPQSGAPSSHGSSEIQM